MEEDVESDEVELGVRYAVLVVLGGQNLCSSLVTCRSISITDFVNRNDCTLTLRALKVSYSDVDEGGIAVSCETTQFFLNTQYLNVSKLRRIFSSSTSLLSTVLYP